MYLRVISSCFGYSRALPFHRKFKITLSVSTKSPSLLTPALLYYILTVWLFKITSFIFNSNFRSYRNFKNFILGDNRRRRVSRFSSTHGSIRSPAAPKAVLHQQVRFLPPWPRSPPGTAQHVATAAGSVSWAEAVRFAKAAGCGSLTVGRCPSHASREVRSPQVTVQLADTGERTPQASL